MRCTPRSACWTPPYAFDDSDHLARFFTDEASDELLNGFEEETGVHTLGAWSAGMRQFTANKPIRSPEDLEGLRMRFPASPQFLMNAEALGAEATEVAYEELFLALQQGTVDGQENPIVNIDASNLEEVQDFISMSSHQANSNLVIIGGDSWGELSAEQQDALQAAVDAAMEQVPGCVDEDEQAKLAEWEETGAMEVVDDVDVEAFRTKADAYLQENFTPEQLTVYEAIRATSRMTAVGEVHTFRGPVPVTDLGTTLLHEHVFVRDHELDVNLPDPEWDPAAMVAAAVDGLRRVHALGVRTVVDLTVPGLGRDVALVAQVAAQVPVHLLASTGWYAPKALPVTFAVRGPGLLLDGPDPLEELFVRDIQQGIAGTGVRAAMLKIVAGPLGRDAATSCGCSPRRRPPTGRRGSRSPCTPTPRRTAAARRSTLLVQHGVDPSRVVLGHSGDSEDVDDLRALMDTGATLGMDRFGMEHVLTGRPPRAHGAGSAAPRLRRPDGALARRRVLQPGHAAVVAAGARAALAPGEPAPARAADAPGRRGDRRRTCTRCSSPTRPGCSRPARAPREEEV